MASVDIIDELSSSPVARFHRPGGRELVFLILLMIATAVLLAWLLVAVTRSTFGDLLPRLHLSAVQPSPSEPADPAPAAVVAPEASVPRETVVDDDGEAERTVREHLYGRRDRRT